MDRFNYRFNDKYVRHKYKKYILKRYQHQGILSIYISTGSCYINDFKRIDNLKRNTSFTEISIDLYLEISKL